MQDSDVAHLSFDLDQAHASEAAASAFDRFQALVNETAPLRFVLQPDCALLINNSRALHARDPSKTIDAC